ncbi:MAG: hypothetical protein JWM11_4313 [Planctomycetaceae bacterium]|nr:hypothetical protein [Planctomycetaceae bacterium]
MSQTHCPHCQAKLPFILDAFCPECRERLDEPPVSAGLAGALPEEGTKGSPSSGTRELVIVIGLIGFASVVIRALKTGDWADVLYTGGLGLALILIFGWCARASKAERAIHNRHRYPRWFVFLSGGIVTVSVLIGANWFWRQQPPVNMPPVIEISEPGTYLNHQFGFRLQYGTEWNDATAEVRRKAREKSPQDASESSFLLGLNLTPTVDEQDWASIILTAEALPKSSDAVSGADYLKQALSHLHNRTDPPKDIEWQQQVVIAGMAFDRLSLRRPWGESEFRMSYWVTVKNGYALSFAGSYVSQKGHQEIESLINRMSEAGR